MPNRILRDCTDRLKEIDAELKNMPFATGSNRLFGPKKWQLYSERRKLRMLIAKTKGDHTSKQWDELLKTSKRICQICGKPNSVFKDHITPISKGGSNHISNIQVLCASCNAKKGNR